MSGFPVWGALNRAVNDATLIDEAIEQAIATHNDDPDSHLGPEQALESHRAAEIIDHRAESVVNDKIAAPARAYVAIVDPTDDYSYDTIQGAVAFAVSKGGGNVLIKAGTHYISGMVELSNSINLIGDDADSVTIIGGQTAGNYLRIVDDITRVNEVVRFQNITFQTTGGPVVITSSGDLSQESYIDFETCNFLGGGTYLSIYDGRLRFYNCFAECNNNYAAKFFHEMLVENCHFKKTSAGATCNVFEILGWEPGEEFTTFRNSTFDLSGTTSARLFRELYGWRVNLYFCTIIDYRGGGGEQYIMRMFGCRINILSAQVFNMHEYDSGGTIIGNHISCAGTGKIMNQMPDSVFSDNFYNGSYSDFSWAVYIKTCGEVMGYRSIIGNETTLPFRTVEFLEYPCNATRTVNTAEIPAGQRRTLRVVQTNTTAKTLTFGGGFRTTGALALGTTANRQFLIEFISDGTTLIETARTGAFAL